MAKLYFANIALYFISRVVHEFYRLDEEAFTVGGCFNAHNHKGQWVKRSGVELH